jgi:hypothetical protein
MNLVECEVTQVISKPYFEYDKWWVKVMAKSYGIVFSSSLMFDTETECLNVSVGYKFLN